MNKDDSLLRSDKDQNQGNINKSLTNQKLHKRILRSKLVKYLDEHLPHNCNKHQQYILSVKSQDERLETNQIEDKEILKSYENFRIRKLIFGPTGSSILKKSVPHILDEQEQFLSKDELLADLFKQLSNDDILEISEDPTYFINPVKYRNFPYLSDPQIWLMSQKFTNSKQIALISLNSHLIQKVDKVNQAKDSSFDYNTIINEKSMAHEEKNRKRKERFLENKIQIDQMKQMETQKLLQRFQLQVEKTNQRLLQVTQSVEQFKEQNKINTLNRLARIKEDQQITEYELKLKDICFENKLKNKKVTKLTCHKKEII